MAKTTADLCVVCHDSLAGASTSCAEPECEDSQKPMHVRCAGEHAHRQRRYTSAQIARRQKRIERLGRLAAKAAAQEHKAAERARLAEERRPLDLPSFNRDAWVQLELRALSHGAAFLAWDTKRAGRLVSLGTGGATVEIHVQNDSLSELAGRRVVRRKREVWALQSLVWVPQQGA